MKDILFVCFDTRSEYELVIYKIIEVIKCLCFD